MSGGSPGGPEVVQTRSPKAFSSGPAGIVTLLLCGLAACGGEPEPRTAEPDAPPPAPADPAPAEIPLAITVDDLPWVGTLPPGETRAEATRELLAALGGHGVPATGFVNCGRAEPGAPVLRLWLDAGMELGNHTENHMDLDRAGLEAWLADARRCDRSLREITGEPSLHFRFPYLHEGRTEARWTAARELLEELGSPVAHVTMVTADWILAAAYGDALRAGDTALAAEIGEEFVRHGLRVTGHYERVARERVGRQIPQVMLLHANALVADYLDPLLARLGEEGYRFVPLQAALEDPVYALPNGYVGPEGISWLYRFEPAAPELAAWDERESAALRERFPR